MGQDTLDTWLWWSSGKDSAWSLHVLAASPRFRVTALVTTVNSHFDRVAMHAVPTALVRAQARAAGLPLVVAPIPHPCPNERYERAFAEAVADAGRHGVAAMAFGDLHLEDVRAYRERLLASTGMRAVFPLWGEDTKALARTMQKSGVRARLTCVDPQRVPADLCGREWNADLVAALPEGTDHCGEAGEFHTYVWAGPMFGHDLDVHVEGTVARDGFVFADLRAGSTR